jgi:hypothetical protein
VNEPNRQDFLPSSSVFSAWTAGLCLLAALASCITAETRLSTETTPTAFAALAQDIAGFRGLPLQRDIVLARAAGATGQMNSQNPFQLQHVERAYKSIGLLPGNVDLGKTLNEFRQLAQLATYDAATGRVALAPEAVKLGAPFAMTDAILAREAPLGFAVIAALQEQNFNWQTKTESIYLEDRRLAFRALATGDAALTLVARANRKNEQTLSASDLGAAGKFSAELEKAAARLPDFLRQQIALPYREGSQFALWALKAKGWPGVDALYANPPLSTAEILHPEKYFLRREAPLQFFPAALLRAMKNSPAVEQSLGEYLIRGLLVTANPFKQASDSAAQWRGDQLFVFADGDNLITVWFSAWQSAADAATFQAAFRAVLEKQPRIRFADKTELPTSALSGRTRDNRGVWLQSNGPVVVFISGVASERLTSFADTAWQDLEIEADATALRFDSARRHIRRHQLSLSSK